MLPVIAGFDWDDGNHEKCQRHGISIADIESLFESAVTVFPDQAHFFGRGALQSDWRIKTGPPYLHRVCFEAAWERNAASSDQRPLYAPQGGASL